MPLFQSNLRKQIRNLPKILNFVKKNQYFSKLFTSLLNRHVLGVEQDDPVGVLRRLRRRDGDVADRDPRAPHDDEVVEGRVPHEQVLNRYAARVQDLDHDGRLESAPDARPRALQGPPARAPAVHEPKIFLTLILIRLERKN